MYRPTAVAVCALAMLACDSKKMTEPADQPVDQPDLRSAPLPSRAFLTPSASAKRVEGVTAMVATAAPHNPRSQAGSLVICFDGVTDGEQDGVTYGGTCQRFLPTKDGAELKTNGGDPDGEYAGLYASPVNIRGKRVGDVQRLKFSYAGGTFSGGSPRWSVAIDEDADGKHEGPVDTDRNGVDDDGIFESYAFADIGSCNDGDTSVGTADASDDGTCTWFYEAESFPNWDSFAGAHPDYKIAQRHADGSGGFIPAFVIADQPGHWVIWNVQVQ